MPKAIATIPPHADFIDEVLAHPAVSGIRLNTVMPIKGSLEDMLKKLDDKAKFRGKDLWVDLKCRQLRIKNYGVPPFTSIDLTHNISVNTPTKAYFCDGKESATVLEVDGNRLIMQEGPRKVVGPGESVNIPDPTLKVEGYFTDTDKKYINAGNKVGLRHYMLSFVEGQNDIDLFKKYCPDAEVAAKIESRKGINYVGEWKKDSRLMAARGDLFVELKMPHYVVMAVEGIVKTDPDAIAASRIFNSLTYSLEPSCEDIGDVDNLMRMGYKTLMLGDDICMHRDSLLSGLNLLEVMAKRYEK